MLKVDDAALLGLDDPLQPLTNDVLEHLVHVDEEAGASSVAGRDVIEGR